jgi:hypothetical protein
MRIRCQPLPALAIALATWAIAVPATGWDASDGPLLEPGTARIDLAGGGLMLERDWSWGLEASLRVGLPARFEVAAPLALGVCLVCEEGSGLVIGGGVVDLWITEQRKLLLATAVALSGQVRVATSASVRLSFDLTGVERGFFTGAHPGWIRGAMALLIDVGPWLTASAGFCHQRLAIGDGAPPGTRRAGWVGDARFSVGAVRTHPFAETPTLAVHVVDWLDIIALVRADIDLDTETTDLRLLGGVAVKL